MQKSSNPASEKHFPLAISLLLIIITLIPYIQVKDHYLINLDDGLYILNSGLDNGLTIKNIKWAFSNTDVGQWIPVVWLSYMLDIQLCGMAPGWFHLTNLFLHIANVVLLFLLLKKLTGGLWESAIVASIFAIHPIHVESVAWVTERKDVLSMFFLLLTISTYFQYIKQSQAGYYILSLILYVLGLMSKPMIVTRWNIVSPPDL